ncbi:L-arabinose 1-dehydrogenase (NAD(P)(+)) [Candidatus Gugararchaeum adminiculabundum]|nr:L-arabinose 1-dehydrogenase (NAD(P)(+)) [Candidatus Gugararchaeum adminiculabundum]
MKILVTGGAGFIGSHIADELVRESRAVIILDNFCSGSAKNLAGIPKNKLKIARADVKKFAQMQGHFKGCDAVFHFAADPDVRESATNPKKSFEDNVLGTFNVLEACRKHDVKHLVFASTSTVYGNAAIPTPEEAPIAPISNYGASKAACEAYVSSYSHSYGIKSTILRYANIFGPRSRHGVIFDFFYKLKKDGKKMQILGDGQQKKSYLFVSDAVQATIFAAGHHRGLCDVYNVGSDQLHTVDEIASLVCDKLGVSPKFSYTGGKQGWVGDVTQMLLATKKLKAIGWEQSHSLQSGISEYIDWLHKNK